jgi:Uma2 family endonuclease
MSASRQYTPRYSVADYKAWEGDWELWGGIPVAMTPSPFGGHQAVLTRLARQIGNELERAKCEAEVLVELDWIISDDTVVRPDLVVVCGPPPQEHLRSAPAIVAEIVSDASHRQDTVHKRDLYDEQGVDVYLVVDPTERSVVMYQRNRAGDWKGELATEAISVTLCEDCVITISKSSLFT